MENVAERMLGVSNLTYGDSRLNTRRVYASCPRVCKCNWFGGAERSILAPFVSLRCITRYISVVNCSLTTGRCDRSKRRVTRLSNVIKAPLGR